jgi:hypothetical protein
MRKTIMIVHDRLLANAQSLLVNISKVARISMILNFLEDKTKISFPKRTKKEIQKFCPNFERQIF